MADPRESWRDGFLEQAALRLYERDPHVVGQGKERPASAALAMHLHAVLSEQGYAADFPAIRVNVDFGREGEAVKVNDEGKQTIPDVIVHVPGAEGPNIAAVEIKGWWNSDDGTADIQKLQGYLRVQRYAFAYFVRLVRDKPMIARVCDSASP